MAAVFSLDMFSFPGLAQISLNMTLFLEVLMGFNGNKPIYVIKNIIHTPCSYFESYIWWHEQKKKTYYQKRKTRCWGGFLRSI